MAVGPIVIPHIHPVAGVRVATAQAGIKKPGRRDAVLFELDPASTVAGVFTLNQFCAAPVQVAKRHLALAAPRYLLVNTGNANAGTGESGRRDAEACCAAVAELFGCPPEQVLPFSTGVIGEPLPTSKIIAALPSLRDGLSESGWEEAAHGIMTTDTRPKIASTRLDIDGRAVHITGIAKGAGMIKPNMATMLAYIATDAAVAQPHLQELLRQCADRSFNRITVDGDTSTNDACMLVASGGSGVVMAPGSAAFERFCEAMATVFIELAQGLVRDGEGATKFVSVVVNGGATGDECAKVAYAVAESPLVKTALFASDPNWGRILAAIGRAGVESLDVDKVRVSLNGTCIAEHGGRSPTYTEAAGQAAMEQTEIEIAIDLARGEASTTVWTTDLGYDYVKINAEYRT